MLAAAGLLARVERQHDTDAAQQLDGARTADDSQQPVTDQRDDRDVQELAGFDQRIKPVKEP